MQSQINHSGRNSNSVSAVAANERAKSKTATARLATAVHQVLHRAATFERLENRTLMSFSAGTLDNSFNSAGPTPGVVNTSISGSDDEAVALTIQSADHKIVVVGNSVSNNTIELARYNPDGSLDHGFGTSGVVTTSVTNGIQASAVATDSAGNLYVTGTTFVTGDGYDIAVAKYNSAGQLVTGFGTGGIATADFQHKTDGGDAIVIDPSTGNVVVAGGGTAGTREEMAIATLNDNTGAVVAKTLTAVGATGNDQANSIAIQGSDYVVGGYATTSGTSHFALARYSSSLVLDNTFGSSGIVTTALGSGGAEAATSIAIGSDSTLYAAGSASGSAALANYTVNGTLLASYIASAGSGFAQANGLAVQYNGKIILTGYNDTSSTNAVELARITKSVSGSTATLAPDTTFGSSGFSTTAYTASATPVDAEANAIAVDSTGKAVIAGTASVGSASSPEEMTVGRFVTDNAPTAPSGATATFDPIDQGQTQSSGNSVISLVSQLGATDVDGDTVGIAITTLTGTGSWQYSTNSGTSWTTITGVSDTNALVLTSSAANLVRFVPTGTATGSATIGLRLWDQTQPYSSGSYVNAYNSTGSDTTANSGTGGQNLNSFSDSTFTASISIAAAPNTVYVNSSWAGDAQNQTVTDSSGTHHFGIDAFATIQNGINFVATGGTVHVDAGTYSEAVTINKSLTLLGAQAGNSATARYQHYTAGNESVVTAPAGTSALAVIAVNASGVIIDGFSIDGGSQSIDGIDNYDASGNSFVAGDVTVQYTIIQNVGNSGIEFDNGSAGAQTTGSLFKGNVIVNAGDDGIGIFDNFYADIQANTIMVPSGDEYAGIDIQYVFDTAGSIDVSSNNITVGAGAAGIFLNNLFGNTGASLTLHGNTIEAANGVTAADDSLGIAIWSIYSGTTVAEQGDTIGTSGGVLSRGVDIWNVNTGTTSLSSMTIGSSTVAPVVGVNFDNINAYGGASDSTLSISSSTIIGQTYGVLIRAAALPTAPPYGSNVVSGSVEADISGGTITGGTAGIDVDAPAASAPYTASVQLTNGVAITGGTTGLLLTGSQASVVGNTLSNTAFTAQTNYITLADGALGGSNPTVLDASGASFAGMLGSALSPAGSNPTAYAVENKITDYLDVPTLGYVELNSTAVYVSQASETTTAGAIQRGVNVAPLSAGTLYIQSGPSTYAGNVTVSNPLTIEGDSETGVTVVPQVGGGSSQAAFTIASSGVTIEKLTVDGMTNTASSDVFNYGVSADSSSDVYNNTVISTDSFKNIYSGGVVLYVEANEALVSTGNQVTGSTFNQIGTATALNGGGYAILFLQSSGTISNNTITHSGNGIGTNFDTQYPTYAPTVSITGNSISEFVAIGYTNIAIYGAGLSLASQINNNTIDTTGDGLADDGILLTYLSDVSGSQLQVENNTFKTDGDDVALTVSHRSFGETPTYTPVLVSGNTFTQSGSTGTGQDVAIQVSDTDNQGDGNDNTDAIITGNTLTGYDTGIAVIDALDYAVTASINGNTITTASGGTGILVSGNGASATIGSTSSNTVSGAGTSTGILVSDNASATVSGSHIYDNATGIEFTASATGSVAGDNFSGSTDNGTDLLIDTTAGAVTIGNGNTFAAATDYIQDLATTPAQNFDLSGAGNTDTFDGVNAATLAVTAGNLHTFYGIEDKIVDAIDQSGLGFVRIHAGDVFVTPGSYLAPATDDTNAVSRAVGVAADGDTVYIEHGTYHETQVVINKGLTLTGDAAASTIIDGGGESNLINNSSGVFNVQNTTASQAVTIQGVTVQNAGTNSNVNGDGASNIEAKNVAGPLTIDNVTIVGANDPNDIDCGLQIVVAGRLTIENDNISNASQGMLIEDASGAVTVTGNDIHNLDVAGGYFPEGILVLQDNSTPVESSLVQISDNTFSGYRGAGILVEGGYSYAGAGTMSDVQIEGNAINIAGDGAPGIGIYNGAGNPTDAAASGITSATISGNTITGDGSAKADGIDIYGFNTGIALTSNAISNTDIGIDVDGDSTVGAPSVSISTGNSISDSTSAGIAVGAGTASITGTTISNAPVGIADTAAAALTFGSGDTIEGGVTGLSISGAAAVSGDTLNNLAFSGQSGNYITLSDGALSFAGTPTALNATGAKFDGKAASALLASDGSAYAVEDKITDYLDDPSLGYVELNPTTVFVAAGSESSADPDAIQRGVNVAPVGGTVDVQAGDYAGQVNISKNLTVDGTGTVVVEATTSMTSQFTTAQANYAVIDAQDAAVTLNNLTVDGEGLGNSYGDGFIGVAYDDASGSIENVTVEDVRNNPLDGVQGGVGILAVDDDSVARSLAVTGSTVTGYQKNALELTGTGLTASITGNTFTGAGSTTQIGQNGIEVDSGTVAHISGNHISGDEYSGAYGGPDWVTQTQATGILLIGAGDGTTVSGNYIDGSDIGIASQSDNASITGNFLGTVSPDRYYGIVVEDGTSTISNNTVTGGDVGIAAYSLTGDSNNTDAALSGNTVRGAATGLLIYDDNLSAGTKPVVTSTGDSISASGDTIVNQAAGSIDVTGDTLDGVAVSSATTAQQYTIADHLIDGVNDAGYGLVITNPDAIYVTPADEASSAGAIGRAEGLASADETIHVEGTLTFDPTTLGHISYGQTTPVSGGVSSGYLLDGNDVTVAVSTAGGPSVSTVISSGNFGPSTLDTSSLNANSYTLDYGLTDTRVLFDTTAGSSNALVIGKATLTITATTETRTYNGTTSATETPTYQVAGEPANTLYGSDTLSGLNETYESKNVLGTNQSVLEVTGYSLSDPDNYTVVEDTTAGTITPATLTITAVSNTKTYDGTASAAGTPTYSGLQTGDTLIGLAETYDTKDVGTGKTLSVSAYTLSDSGDYNVVEDSVATGEIDKATLTITAVSNTKTYDGTTSAASTPTYSGLQFGDTLTGLAETYDTKDVGTGKTLSVSAYTLSDSGDYNVVENSVATGEIDKATLTITAVSNTKSYDGTTSAVGTPTYSGLQTGDTLTGLTETYDTKDVGTGKTLSVSAYTLSDSGDYNVVENSVATGEIDKATLTITAVSNTKTYDGTTTAAGTPTYSGLQTGDTLTGLAETYDSKHVGTGKTLSVSAYTLSDSGDYNVVEDSVATGEIDKATLTITAVSNTKTYDSTTSAAGTPTYSGLQTGDTLIGLAETYDTKDVGTGKTLSVSAYTLSDSSDYNVVEDSVATGEIDKATLTITAVSNTKSYDGTTSAVGTPTYSGLQTGDTLTGLAETYDTKDVGTGKTLSVSAYTLTDATDYNVVEDSVATGEIDKATLTITSVSNTKTYDGTTTAAGTPTYSGLQSGDTLTGLTETYDTKDVGTGKTLSVSAYTLSDSGDYNVVENSVATGEIDKATLTITAVSNTKTYDGTTSAVGTPTYSGLQTGDTLNGLSETYDTKDVGTGKTLSVSAYTLSDSRDYNVVENSVATGEIDKATLTITAVSNTKTYDGTTSAAGTPTYSGLQTGDTLTGLSETYDTKDVGTGKTLSVSAYTLSDSGDYNVVENSVATGEIDKATLTITAVSNFKTYDGTTSAASTPTYSGLQFGDTLTGFAETYDTKDVGTGKTLSVSAYTLSDSGDYNVVENSVATGEIDKATLTITAVSNTKTYDGTTAAAGTPTYSGLQAGDTLTGLAETYDTKHVGTGKTLSVSAYTLSDSGDYNVVEDSVSTGEIDKATLTITAVSNTKTYDSTTSAAGTPTYSGLQTGDTLTGLTETYDTKDAGTGKTLSVSAYTLSDSSDYNVVEDSVATGEIDKATLTITAAGINKVYDGTTAAAVNLSDNHIGNDQITENYGSATFSTRNVGAGETVSISGITIGGADAGNYTFNTTASTTANITKATLTISAVTNTKTYDGTTSAAGLPTYVGLQTGDSLGGLVETYSDKNAGTGKTLGVSAYSLSDGNNGGNYTVVEVADNSGVINQRQLTISATGINKVYDGTTTAAVNLSDNRVAGDQFTDAYSAANFNNPSVGNGKPVSVTGISISGADAANYTFNTTASTTASITTRSIVVTGSSFTIAEGSAYTGPVATFTDANGLEPAGVYTVTINWGDNTPTSTGTVTISGSTATVTGTHTYADGPNSYPVSVDISDGSGGTDGTDTAAPATATVTEVNPTLTLSGSSTANEGSTYTLSLTSSDPGTHVTTLSWLVSWGDGETSTVSAAPFTYSAQTGLYTSTVTATHTYVNSAAYSSGTVANYTVSATATDSDGTYSAGNTLAVAVAYVPPTVPLSDTVSNKPVEASPYTLDLGALVAPGGAGDGSHAGVTTTEYIVNWGDDSSTTVSGSQLQSFIASGGTLTHTFEQPLTYTITLDVLDSNGYHSAAETGSTVTTGGELTVVVQDVPPTSSFSGSSTLSEGSSGSVTFYNQADVSPIALAAGFTYQVDLVNSATGTIGVIRSITVVGRSAGNGGSPVTVAVPAADLQPGRNIIRGRIIDQYGGYTDYYQTITVTAGTFQVTSFTATTSGFDATFNDPVNLSTLHIYGSAGGFGNVSDVTLVGASTGLVRGSLVWDSSTDTAHFVKTGGALLPDTYTVTLVSGSYGWTDTAGAALDGTANGGSHNYTSTFVVASTAGEPTLSVPNFARGPGQTVTVPVSGTSLPIQLSNASGVYSVDFHLIFNKNLLTITSATLGTGLPSGWTLTANMFAGPGQINFTASGSTAISTNSLLTLVNLSAFVPSNAAYGSAADIQLQMVSVNGGNMTAVAPSAIEKVAYFGDASGNGALSGADSSLISRVVVGIDSGFNAFPLTDPVIIGNVSGTGTLNGLDAVYVSQASIGLAPGSNYVPAIPTGLTLVTGGVDPAISIPTDTLATRGSNSSVPIYISDLTNYIGSDFTLTYNPALLQLSQTSLSLGTLPTSQWAILYNPANGKGDLYQYSFNSPNPTGAGTLANISVNVPATANPGQIALNITGNATDSSGSGGSLSFTYTSGSIDIPPDFTGGYYTVKLDGSGNVDVWENAAESSTPTYVFPQSLYSVNANFDQLIFNTTASGGSVTIDETNGDPLPSGGVAFNGTGTGNTLIIDGGSGTNTATVGSTGYAYNSDALALSDVQNFTFNAGTGNNTLTQNSQAGGSVAFNYGGGTDDLIVNGGTYTFAAAAPGSGVTPDVLDSITIASGAKVVVAAPDVQGDRHVLELNTLFIAGSTNAWHGSLDLTGNDLIVHNGNLAQLSNQLASGYNAGGTYWKGTGISSTTAANDPTFLTALGVELNNNNGSGQPLFGTGAPLGLFDGQNPSSTDVLIKYTYYGDANLDGKVDGSDYARVDNGFLNHLTGWSNGDFNYDGAIDGSDYTLIDNAFNMQGAALAALIAPSNTAQPTSTVSTPAAAGTTPKPSVNLKGPVAVAKRQKQTASGAKTTAFATSVFQTQTPIAIPESIAGSIEESLQKKDLLEDLSGLN